MLLEVLDKHVRINGAAHSFVYGPYETITMSQAAHALGLARNFGLLQALVRAKGNMLVRAARYT